MTTFDLVEVRGFAADLDARMDRCENGEGMECANLDDALRHFAIVCCEFRDGVRQWGRAVFVGRAAFDPAVERLLLDQGYRLYDRAVALVGNGQSAEGLCYALDGLKVLQSALWDLSRLLGEWVTPKLAVGPSARQGLPLEPAATENARRRIASLPPLPADWQPAHLGQRKRLRMLKSRSTS